MTDHRRVTVEGRQFELSPGITAAAASCNHDRPAVRTSVTGSPRGPLCGMGVCFECRATVDGEPHVRTCATHATRPPSMSTEMACDVLVVGAGPAGQAAAREAASRGRSVIVVDDNASPGGQIWRRDHAHPRVSPLEQDACRLGATFVQQSMVLGRDDRGAMMVAREGASTGCTVAFRRLVLATGASERFVPFPGWTLPGVMGAGALQAMLKQGMDVRGRGVVVAGSGPLLLAVAALARRSRGARVVGIVEQSPPRRVRGMLPPLLGQPAKLLQGAGLLGSLAFVPRFGGWWPVAALGDDRVRAVEITDGTRRRRLACDVLACGFGLVPRTRLAATLGCRVVGGAVMIDHRCATSVPDVFAAGECTGIGGVGKSIVEGRIAGAAAAGDDTLASTLAPRLARELAFMRALASCYALRPELRTLAADDTIVCRCEDVARGSLRAMGSWREAKLRTRLGMGPCQGCVCGPIASMLEGWTVEDARPPAFNVPLAALRGLHQGTTTP